MFYSEHERSDDSDKCDRGFKLKIVFNLPRNNYVWSADFFLTKVK